MSKINELIYSVREAVKETIDDTEISDSYILYLYGIKRSKFIRQQINSFQRVIDITVQQTLCIDTEVVDANECGVESCDVLVRSSKPLPDLIQLNDKSAIIKVGAPNRISRPFNFVKREKAVYSKNSPFPNSIYSFLHTDNHIYLTSSSEAVKLIDCITVIGVFENPLDLREFNDCCGCNKTDKCFTDDSEYPLQSHLIDVCREEVINDILRTKQIVEDKNNNSND